jgi:hypothetical protein
MSYAYTLIIDHAERIAGTAKDAKTLAAEMIWRAKQSAKIALPEATLADAIATGSSTIDLRLRPPQVTARMRML